MSTTNPPRPRPKPNDPNDPNSALSRKMRLAAWITGACGNKACPSTAAAFRRMARERCDVARAREAWDARRKEALEAHGRRWGRSGVAGLLEDVAKGGPRPRGTELIRWWKEEGGGSSSGERGAVEATTVGGQTAAEPAYQPAEEHRPGEEAG